jgi:hypothetical protein
MCHNAFITAVGDTVIVHSQVQNAIAHTVPVAVSEILLVHDAEREPITCQVAVTTILQVQLDDTTSESSHSAVRIISHVPFPFTHITGFAVLDN